MSIKVLNEESVEYSIYAVKSTPDEAIELNDDCMYASGFTDKSVAIGYAICVAESFDFTDVFIVETVTVHNYWNTDGEVKNQKIVWSCMKVEDEKSEMEFTDSDGEVEFTDEEITEETDELVDSQE